MKTRTARRIDLLGLRKLSTDQGACVIVPSQFEDASGVIRSALVPGGEKLWVADGDEGMAGFVQARPRKYVLGWELVRLYARSASDRDGVVSGLINEVLLHVQERGIPRLFGRTPAESQAHELLLRCGFTYLLSESIFVRQPTKTTAPEETPIGMRYRMPQDAWPLRQLENSQAPVLVSQLEGLTSLGWSTPVRRFLRKDEPTELVVEREGELVGWSGWTRACSGPGSSEYVRLGLLAQGGDVQMATALLDHSLHSINGEFPNLPVVIRLRDYQMRLQQVVLDQEFALTTRETLHIKHGRLQVLPKRVSRLLELAPTLRAFSLGSGQGGTYHA